MIFGSIGALVFQGAFFFTRLNHHLVFIVIISHKYHFIFFKPMKSAGSSVEVAFLPHCGPTDISTGTAYIEELESKEYDYFEQNNTKIVKI